VPGLAYAWLGLRAVDVAPSPKLQVHVSARRVRFVNRTTSPSTLTLNSTMGAPVPGDGVGDGVGGAAVGVAGGAVSVAGGAVGVADGAVEAPGLGEAGAGAEVGDVVGRGEAVEDGASELDGAPGAGPGVVVPAEGGAVGARGRAGARVGDGVRELNVGRVCRLPGTETGTVVPGGPAPASGRDPAGDEAGSSDGDETAGERRTVGNGVGVAEMAEISPDGRPVVGSTPPSSAGLIAIRVPIDTTHSAASVAVSRRGSGQANRPAPVDPEGRGAGVTRVRVRCISGVTRRTVASRGRWTRGSPAGSASGPVCPDTASRRIRHDSSDSECMRKTVAVGAVGAG